MSDPRRHRHDPSSSWLGVSSDSSGTSSGGAFAWSRSGLTPSGTAPYAVDASSSWCSFSGRLGHVTSSTGDRTYPRGSLTETCALGKDLVVTDGPTNAAIADELESYAALLELADASPYAARAYRRAGELVRTTPAPVAALVRSGRVRELRGIGPGIEARLRELVESGEIAELRDLRTELRPELIGLGRLLGLSTRRTLDIGRTLGIETAEETARRGAGRPPALGAGNRPQHRGEDQSGPRASATSSPRPDVEPCPRPDSDGRGRAGRRSRR